MDVSQISLLNAYCQGHKGTKVAMLSGFRNITAHTTSDSVVHDLASVFDGDDNVHITFG